MPQRRGNRGSQDGGRTALRFKEIGKTDATQICKLDEKFPPIRHRFPRRVAPVIAVPLYIPSFARSGSAFDAKWMLERCWHSA